MYKDRWKKYANVRQDTMQAYGIRSKFMQETLARDPGP